MRDISVRVGDGDGGVRGGEASVVSRLIGHYKTEYLNLGEAVQVVADRERVTARLDASGPGVDRCFGGTWVWRVRG